MRFQGAVINEQGVTFAIIIVKHHIIDNRSASSEAAASFAPVFPGMPIILMAQDSRGVPTYFGRQDIVAFLAHIPMSAIPWKEYTLG
jgi:hypothetical protein